MERPVTVKLIVPGYTAFRVSSGGELTGTCLMQR